MNTGNNFFLDCHQRWCNRIVRVIDEDSPDDWIWNQCESCVFYVRLTGEFKNDWGVCANQSSEADGLLKFAHDGCDSFLAR